MIFSPDMLDILQSAAVSAWEGTVYRHMFGSHPPARSNTMGARWNAPGAEAIYTSCERETALAEAEYYIALQPLRPKAKRTLYTIHVSLKNVIDSLLPVSFTVSELPTIFFKVTINRRADGSEVR